MEINVTTQKEFITWLSLSMWFGLSAIINWGTLLTRKPKSDVALETIVTQNKSISKEKEDLKNRQKRVEEELTKFKELFEDE